MLPNRSIQAYVARVKNASLREMVYRVNQAITVRRMEGEMQGRKIAAHIPFFDAITTDHLQMPSFVLDALNAVIADILGGRIFTLHEEPRTVEKFESRWSGTYFSAIRLAPDSPDIRSVWEKARLQHLTILLVHAHQNPGDPGVGAVKSFARDRMLAWIRQNPFLNGPHYMSPMECGLRMPVFFYALMVLDDLTPRERIEILEALYLHAWWVSRNLSLYSSLGNHTICECTGLIFAGAVFQRSEEGRTWMAKGVRIMKQELQRQILDDGGTLEQSLAYHRFVLDLFWLATDFLEKNTPEDCTAWKKRLGRAEAFLAAFHDGRGNLPSLGDSDDGHAVAPGIVPNRTLYADQFGEAVTFAHAGYTLIRLPGGGLLGFDHGPLGMPPLYNHGHADALSVTLSLKGTPFLIDSGTYRYNGEPRWRHYFKSTRAHNTVSIDGEDQAVQDTEFIWSCPFSVRLVRKHRPHGKFAIIEAEHDGYTRLKKPVVHRRAIHQVDDFFLLVRDCFLGQGIHRFELNWHIHPRAEVIKEDGWWRIKNSDRVLSIRLAGREDFDLLCGGMDPLKGWYSPQYGVRGPCPVLTRAITGEPSKTEFVTVLYIGPLIGEG